MVWGCNGTISCEGGSGAILPWLVDRPWCRYGCMEEELVGVLLHTVFPQHLWSFFLLCLPSGRAVKVVLIGGAATGADRYIMKVCSHGCDDVSDGVSTDDWAPYWHVQVVCM